MARMYTSPITDLPPLPRQSLFTYLFPQPSTPAFQPPRDLDAPAFIDGLNDRILSYRVLESQAKRLASGIRGRLGLRKGDVACVFGLNSLEWLNAVYGCLAANVVVSTVNYGYTPSEVLHQLKDSTARMCFVSPALYPVLVKALDMSKKNEVKVDRGRIVLLCPSGSTDRPNVNGLRCVEEIWGEKEAELDKFYEGDEQETAFLCYSSGTVSEKHQCPEKQSLTTEGSV